MKKKYMDKSNFGNDGTDVGIGNSLWTTCCGYETHWAGAETDPRPRRKARRKTTLILSKESYLNTC